MSKSSFPLSPIDDFDLDEEEPVESEGLQMVCRKLPVLERHSSTQFVQAVNTAINRMGSKFGLCDLVDEEEEPDDVGPQKVVHRETSSARLRRRVATTPSQLNHLAQNPNPKRMMRRRSLDLEAAEAWDQAISKRGLGDKLPLRGDSKGSGSPPGSPLGGPTMRELGLPLIFRRNSHSLLNIQKMGLQHQSSKDLPKESSQVIAEDKLQESSQTRASILDFEHLFVQYFVEVTPLKQSKEFSGTHREWLAQPKADAVVKAWKEVLVEGLLARKELILQHWPELQLNKESLYSKLNKELLVQDELAGPKRRVLLTLAPEQVCHRLLWALGDSIPAELGLKDCAARLQERFPQSRIRCSDSVLWPGSVIRTLFFLATALLLFGLRVAAAATWAAYQAEAPLPGKKKKVDLTGPSWEEYLDQLSARLILASSLAYFWLLYGIAAAFPLRSLHSPFKRDLGCLAAYSRTGTILFRVVAPIAASGVPAAMAVRFDRLGLGLLVPAHDRPAGFHTAALAGACTLPFLSMAASWSIRSSFYSHHQLFMVLLFVMHMACALGFVLYFEMMKWAVMGAAGVVFAGFYLFVWYQASLLHSSSSAARAEFMQHPRLSVLLCIAQISSAVGLDITVTSTSRSNGNSVDFVVDGQSLQVQSARGMNVAVIDPDGGSLQSFQVFDTHAAGSEALAAFVAAQPSGSLVLFAARDDAQSNMTQAAKDAIKSCGGTMIESLTYRGSYALIGVKDGTLEYFGAFGDMLVEYAGVGGALPMPRHCGGRKELRGRRRHRSGFWELCPNAEQYHQGEQYFEDRSAGHACSAPDPFVVKLWTVVMDLESPQSAGNEVIFHLDGVVQSVATDRGMNVAVIKAGLLDSFQVFDTHAAGSEALVAFMAALPSGTVVACGVKDEAMSNMSAAAKDAMKSCGATLIDSLSYRGSYALIGIKDGPALAEQTLPDGQASVVTAQLLGDDPSTKRERRGKGQVNHVDMLNNLSSTFGAPFQADEVIRYNFNSGVTYVPSTTVTTTELTTTTELATTTAVPSCAMLTCPSGFVLKANMWEIESQNETVCCQPAAEDMADLGVRSAGFADGNEAVFFANGVEFYHAPARGLTLVLVRPDGTRKDSQTFDTMLNDNSSENLVAFIDSIPDGTIVLVGARDEASIHLSLAAKEAIKSLGATMTIDQLSFRASYALVGVKNGAKLSESLRKTTEGYAVAVGQMKVVISVDANKPLCDTSAPTPAVSGYVSQGNLNLDAGCRYNLFEASHATQCMQGSWIMMTGSSNTLLEFGNLINFLAPDEYAIDRAGEMIGASAVADVVIEEGKVTHWATVSNQLPECRQVDASLAQQNRPACKQAIEALFAQAPAYSSSGVRITMFISFFWYRTELALELIAEDALWSAARVGVVTQVGAWYNVCSVTKEEYCPRKELLDMDRDPAIQVFKDEMEVVLAQMDSFCTTGRASQLGCYVQTISWTNGVRDNENFQVMNGYIEEAMAGRLSSSFRLVDFFKLGGAMPEEVVQGHGSQMLNLWVWQVMFNAMCPAELAASGTYAVWEGNLCSGTEARFENCPNYYPSCLNGPRCEKWECMNSVPCTFRATDPPMAGNSAGLCDDAINISSFLADQPEAEVQMLADGCHNSRGLRVRLWCTQDLDACLKLNDGLPVKSLMITVEKYHVKPEQKSKATAVPAPAAEPERRQDGVSQSQGNGPVVHLTSRFLLLPSNPAVLGTIAVYGRIRLPPQSPEVMTWTSPWRTSKSAKTAASRAASRAAEEDFADVLDESAPAVLARSKSHITLKSEAPKSEAADAKSVKSARSGVGNAPQPSEDDLTNEPETCNAFPEPVKPVTQPEPVAETRVEEPVKQINIRAAGNKYPLGLARFMGSTHVVVGHLFAKGVTSPTYFFGWGFTWVPWFFMLSGFVLFSAYLKNPKEETMIQYVLRRSTTIYPLYAFSLIPAFILGKAYGTMAAEWPTLLAQSFLLQAWVPHFTENALQMHCWFLSCLAEAQQGELRPLWQNLAGNHQFYQTDDFLDIGVIVLKYHPICYFHVFILGMLLAKLRQLLDKKATASPHGCFSWRNPYVVALQFVAPLGYLALLLVFSVQEFQAKAWGYKLSARVSVLLPFQAMILFGLAGLPSLPLPYFSYMFSKMDFLENYSYCVYVFQFLCYAIWPQTGLVNLFWYIIYTYATAFLLARLIQQPIQKWWAAHTKARLVVPFVLGTFLVGFSFLPDPAYDNSLPDLPASIMIDNRTVDVRLNLEDPEGRLRGAMVINPSFLIQDGQILVAARRHRRETLQRNGIYHGPEGSGDAVIIDQIWHSEILLGSKAIDADAWKKWPTGGYVDERLEWIEDTAGQGVDRVAWLCVVETWIPSNSTVIRHIVTGPEDPKPVGASSSVTLAFDSKPPHGGGG
ncbi:unnamed protein product [Durusdinium trenchii]|uniref:ILEI/PANDER domain-containing protein n=1 Tax=Durusdinium trenchii TaxID=1381693 RepID=A0ABP0NJJ2_9DINO